MPEFQRASNTLGSEANKVTAPIFIWNCQSFVASKTNSQFLSLIVTALLMPSICVCTAEATPVLQTLELFTTTLGAFAVGGVELVTTVDDTVLSALLTSVVTATKVIAVSKINNVFI